MGDKMTDKLILLAAIVLLFIGVVSIFLARELVRKKNIDNENVVVRNIKIVGFIVIIISLLTIYFCKLGGV